MPKRRKQPVLAPGPVQDSALAPGAKVDVLFINGSRSAWVQGYRVFDPNQEFSTNKGCQSLTEKRRAGRDRIKVFGTSSRPLLVARNRVRPAQAGSVSFADLFGRAAGRGHLLSGVEQAEVEDLTIGFEFSSDE